MNDEEEEEESGEVVGFTHSKKINPSILFSFIFMKFCVNMNFLIDWFVIAGGRRR